MHQVRRALARLSELPPEQAHFVASVRELSSGFAPLLVHTFTRRDTPTNPSSLIPQLALVSAMSSYPALTKYHHLVRAGGSHGSKQEWPKSQRHDVCGGRRQRPYVQLHVFACKNLDRNYMPHREPTCAPRHVPFTTIAVVSLACSNARAMPMRKDEVDSLTCTHAHTHPPTHTHTHTRTPTHTDDTVQSTLEKLKCDPPSEEGLNLILRSVRRAACILHCQQ